MSSSHVVAGFRRPARILPVIVLSQFAGASLWFATNAVLPDLQRAWNLPGDAIAATTSSVQLGFIAGTLAFAFFMLPDRFSPRLIFLTSSMLGASFNLLLILSAPAYPTLLLLRFFTGVALAGIYPVGMKIASGWYRDGLGTALGFLVGALVLGTAFPHLLRSMGTQLPWQDVLYFVSVVSAGGGIAMALMVPDGPFIVRGKPFSAKAIPAIFRSPELRAAAFGYFGHMWELYTLYAFTPVLLASYVAAHAQIPIDVSFWSFCIIAAGSVGCIGGGIFSGYVGSARVAWAQLCISGLLCACSPLLFNLPLGLFLAVALVWGITVVGDSPQFSTLIARNAPPDLVGSALAVGNSIGFAITVVSIEAISYASTILPPHYLFLCLLPGPALGLLASARLVFAKAEI